LEKTPKDNIDEANKIDFHERISSEDSKSGNKYGRSSSSKNAHTKSGFGKKIDPS
jgi:hypothetical protein